MLHNCFLLFSGQYDGSAAAIVQCVTGCFIIAIYGVWHRRADCKIFEIWKTSMPIFWKWISISFKI